MNISKVTRVVKVDNDNEVYIWLESGKLLSCSTDDGKDYELAFKVKVGDLVSYEKKVYTGKRKS